MGCCCLPLQSVGFSGWDSGLGLGLDLKRFGGKWSLSLLLFGVVAIARRASQIWAHTGRVREKERTTCCHNAPATCNLNRQHATCNTPEQHAATCNMREEQPIRLATLISVASSFVAARKNTNYYCSGTGHPINICTRVWDRESASASASARARARGIAPFNVTQVTIYFILSWTWTNFIGRTKITQMARVIASANVMTTKWESHSTWWKSIEFR